MFITIWVKVELIFIKNVVGCLALQNLLKFRISAVGDSV